MALLLSNASVRRGRDFASKPGWELFGISLSLVKYKKGRRTGMEPLVSCAVLGQAGDGKCHPSYIRGSASMLMFACAICGVPVWDNSAQLFGECLPRLWMTFAIEMMEAKGIPVFLEQCALERGLESISG